MTALDSLLPRIRGEYGEMPGLRLTFTQACRLWDIDPATCHAVLEHLVAEWFLHRAHDGAYTTFPAIRATSAKAMLSASRGSRAHTRQSA